MIKIHFVVNPISGKGQHKIDQSLLDAYFPSAQYDVKISYSTYKKEAVSLTQKAILDNPDIIVACGGDGTIHEVAAELVGKNIGFGILPVGSGNGLASNLEIPKDLVQAIALLKKGSIQPMDVGYVNDRYFFSNMGFGIDATIIEKYEKSGKRKLGAYVQASLNAAKDYKAKRMEVHYENEVKTVNPLLLFVSNSNEMGYKMSLTPKASIRDGLLDFLLIPRISIFKQMYFGLLVVLKKTHLFKNAICVQVPEMEVRVLEEGENTLQLDGEYYSFSTATFKIGVHKGALRVIC